MKNCIKVAECSDYDTLYGIMLTKASEEELQGKIAEIKAQFDEDGNDDWTIEDVFGLLPAEWECEFIATVGTVEI